MPVERKRYAWRLKSLFARAGALGGVVVGLWQDWLPGCWGLSNVGAVDSAGRAAWVDALLPEGRFGERPDS